MLSAQEILNNIGSLIPSIYILTRTIFGVIGFLTAVAGVALIAKKEGSSPGKSGQMGGVWLLIIGALMFTSGRLVESGNLEISGSSTNYSTLASYTASNESEAGQVALHVSSYYLRFFSFALSFLCLYSAKTGILYDEKGWGMKCVSLFVLSILFLGIATYADAIGELFGYSSIGTDYFTID